MSRTDHSHIGQSLIPVRLSATAPAARVTSDAAGRPQVSGTWDSMPDGHSEVSEVSAQDRSCSGPGGRSGHAGRTPTRLAFLGAAVACGSSGPGPRPAAGHTSRHLGGATARPRPVSALVADVRVADGHLSLASDRRRHQHGHRHSLATCAGHQPSGRALAPEAADGQSADRSAGTTSSTLLKAGPAGGRLRRPSSRRQRPDGHRGTVSPSAPGRRWPIRGRERLTRSTPIRADRPATAT